jgi:hypothetical protein
MKNPNDTATIVFNGAKQTKYDHSFQSQHRAFQRILHCLKSLSTKECPVIWECSFMQGVEYGFPPYFIMHYKFPADWKPAKQVEFRSRVIARLKANRSVHQVCLKVHPIEPLLTENEKSFTIQVFNV